LGGRGDSGVRGAGGSSARAAARDLAWRVLCQRVAKLKDDKNRLDRNHTETRKELDQVRACVQVCSAYLPCLSSLRRLSCVAAMPCLPAPPACLACLRCVRSATCHVRAGCAQRGRRRLRLHRVWSMCSLLRGLGCYASCRKRSPRRHLAVILTRWWSHVWLDAAGARCGCWMPCAGRCGGAGTPTQTYTLVGEQKHLIHDLEAQVADLHVIKVCPIPPCRRRCPYAGEFATADSTMWWEGRGGERGGGSRRVRAAPHRL